MIEYSHIGVRVVQVVRIRRILNVIPQVRRRYILVKQWILRFTLVVHRIEANHVLQELVQLRVTGGSGCYFQQW